MRRVAVLAIAISGCDKPSEPPEDPPEAQPQPVAAKATDEPPTVVADPVEQQGHGAGAPAEMDIDIQLGEPDVTGPLPAQVITRIVRMHNGELRLCHYQALSRNPKLEGELKLFFKVKPGGGVSKVETSAGTFSDVDALRCMSDVIKRWRFPKSDPSATQVAMQITLSLR